MNFEALMECIRRHVSEPVAAKIEGEIKARMRGVRLTIPPPHRRIVTEAQVRAALARNRWNIERAASELGVHPSTVYRRLRPRRPGSYDGGRPVR